MEKATPDPFSSVHEPPDALARLPGRKKRRRKVNREFVRPFSGGSRLIQPGLLTPLEVLVGSLPFFALGSRIGLYPVWTRGLFIPALGAVALLSGVFYTGHPFNRAGRGVGEAVVGLNFGSGRHGILETTCPRSRFAGDAESKLP